MFPPFSILARTLRKLEEEEAEALLILPKWPNQAWYSTVMRLAIQPPLVLPQQRLTIFLPHLPHMTHPIWKRLKLTARRLSGKRSKKQVSLTSQ